MEVVTDTDRCPSPPEGTAVTIGAYDGVHRGHQAVIATVRRLAAERGLETAVVTFDRHPASVVRPASAPRLLTDLDQKLELLAATGLDHAVVLHFDEARSKESAEDFVLEVLVGCLNTKLVVVGEDFHFGHQRQGDVHIFQIVGGGAENLDSLAVRAAAFFRNGNLRRARKILPGQRCRRRRDQFRFALRDEVTTSLTSAGAKVHHKIRAADSFFVMLHHQNGVAEVAELFEGTKQAVIVTRMQTYGGLVEHIQNAAQA